MTETVPEESSWTMYFEDFLLEQNNEKYYNNNSSNTSFSYGCDQRILTSSNSLISDAGSSSASKKENHQNIVSSDHHRDFSLHSDLNFKKRKTHKQTPLLLDHALEDTATSPLCCPKFCNIQLSHELNVKPDQERNINKGVVSHEERENTNITYGGIYKRRRSSKFGLIDKNSDYIELKKKGLCLVPLSMLVNYLG